MECVVLFLAMLQNSTNYLSGILHFATFGHFLATFGILPVLHNVQHLLDR